MKTNIALLFRHNNLFIVKNLSKTNYLSIPLNDAARILVDI